MKADDAYRKRFASEEAWPDDEDFAPEETSPDRKDFASEEASPDDKGRATAYRIGRNEPTPTTGTGFASESHTEPEIRGSIAAG